MNNNKEHIVLGISPGTKEIGFAVMRGTELLYWANKSFKGVWSIDKKEKIQDVIQKVLMKYEVSKMAIKIPDERKSSPALNEVVKGIKGLCKTSKITVKEYSLNDLKEYFIGTSKSDKKDLVAIVGMYDELMVKGRSWDEKYYIKVIEAIACARVVNMN